MTTTTTPIAGNLIEGRWTTGDAASLPVIDPSSAELIADLASASSVQVDQALRGAKRAQKQWQRTAPTARATLLHEMARVMRENVEVLADLTMRESGKTKALATFEVGAAADYFDYNAEWALRLEGEIIPSDGANETIHLVREPIGVVVAIGAWNFPLMIAARKAAPALAAGNAVVVKPSELTPLATVELIRLFDEHLDLPAGVLSVVVGAGDVGARLVTSLDSDMVTFTGHRDTGKRIMADCAETLTRVSLELGGKASAIVLDDADLDVAVPALVTARFIACGQVCGAAERILVQSGIAAEFTRRYVDAVEALRVGDPQSDPDLGPLVGSAHLDKVARAVALARSQGATVATGGDRVDELGPGFYFRPTVVTGVTEDMSIAVDETFGPVVAVTVFDEIDEALEIANSTRYGLGGYVFSTSYSSVMRITRDLECGELFVNRAVGEAMQALHGGHKESGYGGEDGKHGFLKYTQLKAVYHNW